MNMLEIPCTCYVPGCEKSLVFYPWGLRINDSANSFKEDCVLPGHILEALANAVKEAQGKIDEPFDGDKEPYAFARWDDDDGNDFCLADGFVTLTMARGTTLLMEVPDRVYVAMQEVLATHGATFQIWGDDDGENVQAADLHYYGKDF